ncbi:hypothetical protein BLNAU_449 [Blattamonas nauphoetae]|uniref:Uncharacterized protein n=1 Tax=Blattamonas nauphoetae TaxID=2049346 RepID=A0ABQ9YLA2_9EUKA|nr:hypothetical protein BLNAU_449 [Blattamonas nauphoetae]
MKPAGYSIPNPEHITCRSIGPDRSNFETTTRSVFSDTKERSLPKAPHLKPHTDPGGFDIVKNEKEDQNQHFAYERYTDNANRRYVSLETTQRNRMVGTRSYVQDNEPHPLGSSTKTRAFGSTQAGGRSQPQSFLPQSSYNIITGG